jgi:methyl-accepting chemotaxis protein
MSGLHLTLRHKIAAIGLLGVAGLALVGGIDHFGAASQAHHQQIASDASAISTLTRKTLIELLETRRAEKDFLLRDDERYATRQGESVRAVGRSLETLKQRLSAGKQFDLVGRIDEIRSGFETYGRNFTILADTRRKLGLDPNSGLEGALRGAVRAIEDRLKEIGEPRLDAAMLAMRRHEKDFMLRREARYVGELAKSADAFKALLAGSSLPAAAKDDIAQKLAAYQAGFTAWVQGAQAVADAQKAMSDAFASIEPKIEAVYQAIEKVSDEAEAASAAAQAATTQRINLSILLVVLGVGGLSFLIGRAVSRPIAAMTEAMRELSTGNLQIAVPGTERRDEIGEMAGAVEIFKANAIERQRLEAEAKETERRVAAQRRADMHKLADQFEAAVGDIVQTVSSASAQLEGAASALTQNAKSTQQLAGSVAAASEQASANVQSVAGATEELSTSVGEISQQVQQSSTIANQAVQQADKTDSRIAQLSQAAQKIGDVVKLITAVAEQTNLLALNATIEAARAGEAGRGFAVVAQEVKALAAQTARATDEIGTHIAGMQAATQEAVGSIREIGSTISRISEIAGGIAAAVEEQGAATREISRNVQQAAQGTDQVAGDIGHVNRGAGETGSASAQVLAAAQSLSSQSGHLKQEVAKFLETVRAA